MNRLAATLQKRAYLPLIVVVAVVALLAGGLPLLVGGPGNQSRPGLAIQAPGSNGSLPSNSLPWYDPRGWFGGGGSGSAQSSSVQAGTAHALAYPSHAPSGHPPVYEPARVTGEVVKDRSEYSRVYQLSDGQLQQVVSAAPVNYRDASGHWQPVNTAVVPSARTGFVLQNTTNNFSAYFGSQAADLAEIDVPGAGSVSIGAGFASGARIVTQRSAKDTVSYAGLAKGVSLQYEVTPVGLKERLVLQSRAAGSGPFTFTLRVGASLVPYQERDGTIILSKDGAGGAPALTIPAPIMTDARPDKASPLGYAFSANISQTATWDAASRTMTITVTPDASWLDAPGRVFPVTVDPTVEIAPTPSDAQNVMIDQDEPTTNLSSSWRLSVGTTTTGKVRSLLYFPLSTVPSGAVLQDADLLLYYDQTFSGANAAEPITVDSASGTWSASTATWNSASGLDSGTKGMTEVDVDDSAAASVTAKGAWGSQAAVSAVNGEYRYDQDTVSGDTFTWTPDLPESGNWTASVHYVADSAAASNAPFTVNYPSGAKSYTVNEQTGTTGDGYWSTLGSGQMNAGTGATIVAGDGPASSTVRVEADEARWQLTAHASVNPVTDDDVWNSFPVTNLVQSWLNGTSTNYGFVVKSATEGTLGQGGPRYEASGYYYNGETSTYPQLVLTWGVPGVSIKPITTIGATGADLSWTPYTNPTSDAGMNLSQYEVYRSVYQSFTPDASTLISPVAAGATSYDDTAEPPTPAGASEGNAFYYMVAVRTTNGTLIPGPTQLVRLPTAGETTVTIPASGATTLASGTPTTAQQNIAGYPWLEVGNNSSTYGVTRTAIQFPSLTSAGVPAGSTLTDAHVKLWGWYNDNTGGGSATYDVNALTQAFTPTTATWDDASSGTAWTTAGGTHNSTVAGSVSGLTNDPDRQDLTITSTAQGWLNGTTPDDGVLVKLASESTTSGAQEHQLFMNTGAAEKSLVPALVVTYIDTLPQDTYYSGQLPDPMAASTSYSVPVSVTNTTASTWAAANWVLSYHWLTPDGTDVSTSGDQTQTALTADMAPAATQDLTASVTTPPVTDGEGGDRQGYILAWDMYDKTTGAWLSSGTSTPAPSSAGTTATAAAVRPAARAAHSALTLTASTTQTVGTLNQVTSVTRSASDLLGLENYYQYTGVNTGSGTSLLTNDDTGNVVWNYNAFSNPSRGFQTFVRLDYNSMDTSESSMGFGWSLQTSTLMRLGSPLEFQPNPSNTTSVILTDGDGTTHTFTWDSSTSTWVSPPGLHYYLQSEAACDPSGKTDNARAWLLTAPDRTQFWFDCQGYETAQVDQNGNEADFTYTYTESKSEPTKFLDYITDPSGRQTLTLTYYQAGDNYQYVDDSTGDLVSGTNLTDPDIIGEVKSITAINGRTMNFYYDTQGLMSEFTDGDGSSITKTFKFGYDMTQGNKNVKLVSVTDPRGDTTDLSYYTAPENPHWKWSVNTISDRMSRATSFTYALQSTGDVQTQVTDPKGNVTTFLIDTTGRPIQATNALNQTTTLGYDSDNNVTSLTEPNGAETTWTYDQNTGYPLTMTDAQANRDGTTGYAYAYATALNGHTAELTSELTPQQRLWTFGYDAYGNLTSVTSPDGNVSGATPGSYTTTYTYDPSGDMLTSTDPDGNTTNYGPAYDPTGYPDSVTDPMGNTTSYNYSATGDITTETTPAETGPTGIKSTYTFDVFGRPTGSTVPEDQANGVYITTPAPVYDGNDNVTESTAPNGAVTTYSYDADDELTSQAIPPNSSSSSPPTRTDTYTYDADGNELTATEPNGNVSGATAGSFTTSYVYDAVGDTTSVTDANGDTTSYGYDSEGNTTSVTDALGNKMSYTYNLNNWPLTVTDSAGYTQSTGYDLDGNVISQTDENGNTTLYTIDPDGLMTQAETPYSGSGSSTTYDITQYKYDQDGNQTEVITPRGVAAGFSGAYTQVTEYNRDGQVSAQLGPDNPDDPVYNKPAETDYTYYPTGNLHTVSAPPSGDQTQPNVTSYDYFDNGWTKSATDPWNVTTSYTYDQLGDETSQSLSAVGGSMTRTDSWSYFPDGSLASRSDAGIPTGMYAEEVLDSDFNNASASPSSDWTTTPCASTTPGCEGYEYQTDTAGSGDTFNWHLNIPEDGNYAVYVKYPVVSGAAKNAAFTVNYSGGTATVNIDQSQDNNGGWVSLGKWAFTQTGTTQQVSLAQNSSGTVVADAVLVVRDNSGETNTANETYSYNYDPSGDLTGITDSGNGASATSYNVGYNQINEVTGITQQDSSGNTTSTSTFGYDADGDLTSLVNNGQTSNYTFDARGLLSSVATPTSLTDSTPQTTNYTYTSAGQVASETKPNGNKVTYSYYDDGNEQSQTEDKSDGTLVASHSYTYDQDGNQTQDTEQVMSANAGGGDLTHTLDYTYNPSDQVTEVTKDGSPTEQYTYDLDGNITNQTVNQVSTAFGYDQDRLLTATTDGVRSNYNYDPLGRLDSITTGTALGTQYTYDGFDQVTAVTSYGSGSASATDYAYDPLGRETSQTTGAGTSSAKTTDYDYLGLSNELVEESVNGTATKTYAYSPWGERLSQDTYNSDGSVDTGYYSYDSHSNVEAVTGSNGNTTATYGYTAYGQDDTSMFTGADAPGVQPAGSAPYNPYQFNSDRSDGPGGYDMGFRDYSPDTGTFLVPDSYDGALENTQLSADPFTGNPYGFGDGNPISNIELNGHGWGWVSDLGHAALNVVGMVPVVGSVADAANAVWYAADGDYGDAALSAAGAIPVIGDAILSDRLAVSGVKLAEDGVEGADDALNEYRASEDATQVDESGSGDEGSGSEAASGDVAAADDPVIEEEELASVKRAGMEAQEQAAQARQAEQAAAAEQKAAAEAAAEQAAEDEAQQVAQQAAGSPATEEGGAASDGVTLSLRYKSGWSPEQIAAANSKVATLDTAAQRGELVVSQAERSGTSAASVFRSAGGEIPPGSDVDHMIDLQLGGADELANLSPLDLSVNRSLGAQIAAQLRGVPVGTCVIGVQIC